MTHGLRAKGKVRRYARANRLDRLATLTYKRAADARSAVVADLRKFFRRLGELLGRMAVVAVIERGKKTGRLHVHLALGRYVPKQTLADLWTHGHVDIRRPGRGSGQWRHRHLARYLAKYVSKDVEADGQAETGERAKGEHRYLVTQGFTPKTFRLRYQRPGFALERLKGMYGQPDAEVEFGDWAEGLIYGIWYSFPDHCLHPPPGTLRPG